MVTVWDTMLNMLHYWTQCGIFKSHREKSRKWFRAECSYAKQSKVFTFKAVLYVDLGHECRIECCSQWFDQWRLYLSKSTGRWLSSLSLIYKNVCKTSVSLVRSALRIEGGYTTCHLVAPTDYVLIPYVSKIYLFSQMNPRSVHSTSPAHCFSASQQINDI